MAYKSFKSFYSQVDYQCFDFVPRHHNVIRFRKGVAMIMNDFQTVCSWVQFKNDAAWKYDLMLSKYELYGLPLFAKLKKHLEKVYKISRQVTYD